MNVLGIALAFAVSIALYQWAKRVQPGALVEYAGVILQASPDGTLEPRTLADRALLVAQLNESTVHRIKGRQYRWDGLRFEPV